MRVAVAAGAFAGKQCLLDFGNGGAIILGESFHPLGFRLHLQQRLLEIKVDRQLAGEMKRKRRDFALDFRSLSQDGKKLLMKFDQSFLWTVADFRRLVIEICDLTLQK